jgi:hypothetical protein
VKNAEEALRSAREALSRVERDLQAASAAKVTAEAHERTVARFREQVAQAAMVEQVDPAKLTEAGEATTAARKALEQGALIREAKTKLAQAEASARKAAEHRIAAIKLRDAAKGTDEVLSSAVAADSGLRVEAGRLVIDTARGPTYFAELSHGERALLALDLGIDAVGPKGVLPISQEFFAALQPENQRKIAQRLRERQAVGVAPFVDDGELRAVIFDDSVT